MVPAELASDGQLATQLQQIQQLQSLPAQVAQQVGAVGRIMPATVGVAGVVLWLAGRRLAGPLVALVGLVLGTVAGSAVAFSAGTRGTGVLVWLIGGGLVGLMLAWLLFRLGVAALLAALLLLAGPAVLIAGQGDLPIDFSALQWHWPQDDTLQVHQSARMAVTDLWSQVEGPVRDWWSRRSYAQILTLVSLAALGGLIGLVWGLLWPYGAAGLITAGVGSAMVMGAARVLLPSLSPSAAAWLPQGPWASCVAVGLITLAGAVLQWIIWRRRADK